MEIVSALKSLISKPVPTMTKKQVNEYTDKVISLRPNPELRHFLEVRSENIGGMSINALCIALLDAYRTDDHETRDPAFMPLLAEVRLASRRVRELFHVHDYGVVETISILQKYNVGMADYFDDIRLSDKLQSQGFADLCKAFSVSQDWLTGRSDWVRTALNFDHNVQALIIETRKLYEEGLLDSFTPICSADALDGSKVIYSGHNQPARNVGIVLILKPADGFKHRTFKVYGCTPFDYERTRIQFKAAMMEAYSIVGSGTFEGRRLGQDTIDGIYGKSVLRVEDFVNSSHYWDPECYFGKPTGSSEALEVNELDLVVAKAKQLFS